MLLRQSQVGRLTHPALASHNPLKPKGPVRKNTFDKRCNLPDSEVLSRPTIPVRCNGVLLVLGGMGLPVRASARLIACS